MERVLTKRQFERLLNDVGALVVGGRERAEAAAGHVLAVTYWKVGERIQREELSSRAGYGEGVMARLADELDVAQATLRRAVQFARMYGQAPEPGLSWAHYKELLTVADDRARARYEALALSRGWSKRELHTAIAERVVDAEGSGRRTRKGRRPARPVDGSFLYRCDVLRVIDGDTLLVHVDLGFSVIKLQRVRLSGVDAPAARTAAGKRAAQWVQEQLARAEAVVMRTEKAGDVHGRYVAHVFYSGDRSASAEEVFRSGAYLNGALVGEGLAEVR